jgi:hypothetical protein
MSLYNKVSTKFKIKGHADYICKFSDNTYNTISFYDVVYKLLHNNMNYRFKYWKCNAGIDRLYIHSNGNIYSCQQYYSKKTAPLFNIASSIDNFKLKHVICPFETCCCDFDIYKKKIFIK